MAKRITKKRGSGKRKTATKTAGSVEKYVMEKIEKGEIKMRSEHYFLVRNFVNKSILILLIFITFLVSSYMFYKLRSEGPLGFIYLGRYGILSFLRLFPWLGIVLAVIAISLIRFSLTIGISGHRVDSKIVIIVIILLAFFSGTAADIIGIDSKFALYSNIFKNRYITDNSVVGQVIGVESTGFLIRTPNGERVKVLIGNNQKSINGKYKIGDNIKIAGYWTKTVFNATALGK